MLFKSKVVMITGAATGIGRDTALAFAREGSTLVIVDIDKERLHILSRQLKELKVKQLTLEVDVTKGKEVINAFKKIKSCFQHLDVLVNNVGVNIQKPTIDYSEDEWDYLINVNLKSTFLCSKEALKTMIPRKSGVIINISSIFGLGGITRRNAYSTAKGAINCFTKTLACEWASSGIRVNAIAPGYILTDALQEEFDSGVIKPDDMLRRTPQGRFGRIEDISDAILFLASDKASFITGAILYVDGGYSAYHGPEINPSIIQ